MQMPQNIFFCSNIALESPSIAVDSCFVQSILHSRALRHVESDIAKERCAIVTSHFCDFHMFIR